MIEERFRAFLTEYKNAVLSALNAKNEDYRRLLDERTAHNERLFAFANGDPVLVGLLENYLESTYLVHDFENDEMYLQGAKDIVKMSKL